MAILAVPGRRIASRIQKLDECFWVAFCTCIGVIYACLSPTATVTLLSVSIAAGGHVMTFLKYSSSENLARCLSGISKNFLCAAVCSPRAAKNVAYAALTSGASGKLWTRFLLVGELANFNHTQTRKQTYRLSTLLRMSNPPLISPSCNLTSADLSQNGFTSLAVIDIAKV